MMTMREIGKSLQQSEVRGDELAGGNYVSAICNHGENVCWAVISGFRAQF